MKVPYSWLRDYVECDWDVAYLADRLTMSGLKVENIQRLGEGLDGIVTATVVSVEPHPDSEQLSIVRVDAGAGATTVVTAAGNMRPGDVVPFAPPGTRLPDGRVIETATVRGVESHGMMCSEAELQIGDDHSGIMILPADTPSGRPFTEALQLDDWVLEFEVYPNRPDCLGVIGIAREVAALGGWPLRLPSRRYETAGPAASELVTVHIDDEDWCRRYTAHLVNRVRIAPSPWWMQRRLRAAGMRPINNVVDVTNFVMLEWGQPLHAFDFNTLEGAKVVVRRARAGESILTLDGQQRALDPSMLVIADARRPVAVAGVMGGGETEVRPDTGTVLLEAAHFHPAAVRRTARRLGMRTEASHRFEKGLDPELPPVAAERALHLLQQLAGADVHPGRVDAYPRPAARHVVMMSPRRVNRFLGVDIPTDEMVGILRRLEFVPEVVTSEDDAEELVKVHVPSFRGDIQREADLAEEIVRFYGFDRVPSTLPQGPAAAGGQGAMLQLIDVVRDVLIGLGLSEAMNYSFVAPRHDDMLRLPPDHPWRNHVRLRNPLSEEHSVMRTSLIGGLLESAARNKARRVTAIHLFEVGSVFVPDGGDPSAQPTEPRRLGILMAGPLPERTWGQPVREADFFALKGVLEELAHALRVSFTFRAGDHPALHPGRQAQIEINGQEAGLIGEVHPQVLEAFEAPARTCIAELSLEVLAAVGHPIARYRPLPRFPLVRRDVALLVPQQLAVAAVEQVMRRVAGELLETVRLFDVYEGRQVPEGYRSVAYALEFRSDERTLTDDEVNRVMGEVEAALQRECGVHVRR